MRLDTLSLPLSHYVCDPACPLEPPEPPNHESDPKSDSKVTFGLPVKVTRKVTQNVTLSQGKVTFRVTFTGRPKVTFESLLGSLSLFGGSGGSKGHAGSQHYVFQGIASYSCCTPFCPPPPPQKVLSQQRGSAKDGVSQFIRVSLGYCAIRVFHETCSQIAR